MSTTGRSPLRRLLRSRAFRRWAIANLFGRLPLTMNLLALVLVGEAVDGSLATGAMLAGILTVTAGVLAQPRGRRLDRIELRGGLQRDLLLSATGMAALTTAVIVAAPVWMLGLLVAAIGAASAAILGGFRALLVPTVTREEIEPANALDAVFVEVAFVAGPALAGALALVVGPVGVLVAEAVAFVVAALLLRWLPRRPPVADLTRSGPAPLRTRGAGSVYLLALGMGLALGGFEATIPAHLASFGLQAAAAGPLLALTAIGSGLAGLVAANQRDPLRRGRMMAALLLAVLALLTVPVALASTVAVLALGLLLFGMPVAPLNALAGLAFQRIVAVPRQAEGFALFPAMVLIGAGVGQALSGVLLRTLSPASVFLLIGLVLLVLAAVVFSAGLYRRLRDLPQGVGFPHDPIVIDPERSLRPGATTATFDRAATGMRPSS